MALTFEWRGSFDNAELNSLHAEAFDHPLRDHNWRDQLAKHSLGWVCARSGADLIAFVNVAWDGGIHAFILDPIVATGSRGQGVGTELIAHAAAGAGTCGCKWLHVDFDDHLRTFYFDACGFLPTNAGLIRLR